jgi:hypothetical protein
MEPPGLVALDVVLAAASETAMVLRPLRREDVLTAVAAAPAGPVIAAAASSTGDSSCGSCGSGASSTGGNC